MFIPMSPIDDSFLVELPASAMRIKMIAYKINRGLQLCAGATWLMMVLTAAVAHTGCTHY